MPTLTPTAGWLAMKLSRLGHELAMSLLGAGLVIASDMREPTDRWYARLAAADEPGYELSVFYAELADTHPWLAQALPALTGWLEHAPPGRLERLRPAATLLADVEFLDTCELAGGELLGQVFNEIVAIERRWREPLAYLDLGQCLQAAWEQQHNLVAGGVFMDGWCATGVRTVAMVLVMRELGIDPTGCYWVLRDPDPFTLALAGLNMVACHAGENISLQHGKGIYSTPHNAFAMATPDTFANQDWYEAPDDVNGVDYMVAVERASLTAAVTAVLDGYDRDYDAVQSVLRGAVGAAASLKRLDRGADHRRK